MSHPIDEVATAEALVLERLNSDIDTCSWAFHIMLQWYATVTWARRPTVIAQVVLHRKGMSIEQASYLST